MKKFLLAACLILLPGLAQAQGIGGATIGPGGIGAAGAATLTNLNVGTLTVSGTSQFGTASTNFLQLNGVGTGFPPTIQAVGGDAAIGVYTLPKGFTTSTVMGGKSHMYGSGAAPTASACAGFALATSSSDLSGTVTFTSATSCAIQFGQGFSTAPFCTVAPGSAASTVQVATSTTVMTATFGTAQTSMSYQCMGL